VGAAIDTPARVTEDAAPPVRPDDAHAARARIDKESESAVSRRLLDV